MTDHLFKLVEKKELADILNNASAARDLVLLIPSSEITNGQDFELYTSISTTIHFILK